MLKKNQFYLFNFKDTLKEIGLFPFFRFWFTFANQEKYVVITASSLDRGWTNILMTKKEMV